MAGTIPNFDDGFSIPDPSELLDSDAESDENFQSDNFGDMTEISIHTPAGGQMQNINSPLDLKFTDMDDSTEESIREEEEAHDDTETGYEDAERIVGEESDAPVAINKLKPNVLVEVALSRLWFPARVVGLDLEEDYCIVMILDSFLAIYYDIVGIGMVIHGGRGRIKPLKNERKPEKSLQLKNIDKMEVQIKCSAVANTHFDKSGYITFSLSCRTSWRTWDLVWQRLSTCRGFDLQEFLEHQPRFVVELDSDSSSI